MVLPCFWGCHGGIARRIAANTRWAVANGSGDDEQSMGEDKGTRAANAGEGRAGRRAAQLQPVEAELLDRAPARTCCRQPGRG